MYYRQSIMGGDAESVGFGLQNCPLKLVRSAQPLVLSARVRRKGQYVSTCIQDRLAHLRFVKLLTEL